MIRCRLGGALNIFRSTGTTHSTLSLCKSTFDLRPFINQLGVMRKVCGGEGGGGGGGGSVCMCKCLCVSVFEHFVCMCVCDCCMF